LSHAFELNVIKTKPMSLTGILTWVCHTRVKWVQHVIPT